MKNNILLALVAAVVYVVTYMFIQGYYSRDVVVGEIAIGGIVFFLAFLATHSLLNRFRK